MSRWKQRAILSHFVKSNKARATNPSPHYHQFGSQHAKEFDKRKQRREMKKQAGTTTSQDVGSGEDCTIHKDEGTTEEEDDNTESNNAKDKIADSVITGSGDFFMSSPNNDHKGCIESAIGGGDTQYEALIGRDGLSLIPHNCSVYSSRECQDTILVVHFKSVVSSWVKEADNWILKIFVKIQGAGLWRFNKHKKRATLGTGEYPPEMNCTLFCGTQGIEVWIGKHPLPSYALHKWSCRTVLPDLV
jgi:hypothetical protein